MADFTFNVDLIRTGNGVKSVEFITNSQNLPTIRITTNTDVIYAIVFWSNNRLILQKTENGEQTTLTTWTGA